METNVVWFFVGGLALFYAWKALGPDRRAPSGRVREKIASGAAVIDVRSPGEFSGGAYPKARNVPLDVLAERLDKIGAKDRPIVVYCASGARSAQAARLLRSYGFTDVTNAGGLGSMPR